MSDDEQQQKKKHKRSAGNEPSIDVLREYNVSGNEEKFEKIISDLKFLSKVKAGDKINVSTQTIIGNTYADRFLRTSLRVESRDSTLKFIKNTITQAINQMYFFISLKEAFYHQLAQLIRVEIVNARRGIENIAKTYSNTDTYTCSRKIASEFEAVITSINVKLQLNS